MSSLAPAGTVTASQYGGADGDSIGSTQFGFAELSTNHADAACIARGDCDFSALGGLPRGTLVRVSYNGKSIIVPKVDVGGGGPGLAGHTRAIDLTASAARALGFSGLGNVRYEILGRTRTGAPAAPATVANPSSSTLTATGPSGDVFSPTQHSDTKYALVFVGIITLAAVLVFSGLNRASGGAAAHLAKRAAL